MMDINQYTVITGASRGLGKCLAESCARRGMNMILIALPGEGINMLANAYHNRFGINAVGYEADLTCEKDLNQVGKEINGKYQVNILINNAGTGGSRPFREATPEYLDNILLLNTWSLVRLTHLLLPNLEKQKESFILNIASLASFGPMPYKTIYPASKSFVYSFSRGLYEEFKRTGIFVSVAHPGGMITNSEVAQRIHRYGPIIRSSMLSPERTAEICVRQLLKKDALIIPGFLNKVGYSLYRIIPVWMRLNLFRISLQKEIRFQTIRPNAV